MRTYNFEMVANAPMLKGAVMECANESRTTKALAVFNTLEMMGIELQTALYKRVAKKYVDSDKAVMMAFAEYQAKTAAPAALDAIDQKLREIADATPDNRTKAMRNIFDYCHTNGITDAGTMRKRCENALNYHNTGRIYNTWKEWETARVAEIKAAKAAARKAKREAKKAEAAAAVKAVTAELKPNCVHISFREPQPQKETKDIFFNVEITDNDGEFWGDFRAKYNEYIATERYNGDLHKFLLSAPESVFEEIERDAIEAGVECDAVRCRYVIYINAIKEEDTEQDEFTEKENMLLRAAKTSKAAPATKALRNMMRTGKLVVC